MKKLIIILSVTLLMTAFFSGCTEKTLFPKDSDFELNAVPAKTSLGVGEELMVKAFFKNLTDEKYTLTSKSGFVFIDVIELNTAENTPRRADSIINIQPKQEITVEAYGIRLDKAGKYKVYAIANFEITDPKTRQQRSYSIRSDETLIEVR